MLTKAQMLRILVWPFQMAWCLILMPFTLIMYFVLWYGVCIALVSIAVWGPIMGIMWLFT